MAEHQLPKLRVAGSSPVSRLLRGGPASTTPGGGVSPHSERNPRRLAPGGGRWDETCEDNRCTVARQARRSEVARPSIAGATHARRRGGGVQDVKFVHCPLV